MGEPDLYTYVGTGTTITVAGGTIPPDECRRLGVSELVRSAEITESYGIRIQSNGERYGEYPKVEVRIEYKDEVKEMTYAEFFTRLGFKG